MRRIGVDATELKPHRIPGACHGDAEEDDEGHTRSDQEPQAAKGPPAPEPEHQTQRFDRPHGARRRPRTRAKKKAKAPKAKRKPHVDVGRGGGEKCWRARRRRGQQAMMNRDGPPGALDIAEGQDDGRDAARRTLHAKTKSRQKDSRFVKSERANSVWIPPSLNPTPVLNEDQNNPTGSPNRNRESRLEGRPLYGPAGRANVSRHL